MLKVRDVTSASLSLSLIESDHFRAKRFSQSVDPSQCFVCTIAVYTPLSRCGKQESGVARNTLPILTPLHCCRKVVRTGGNNFQRTEDCVFQTISFLCAALVCGNAVVLSGYNGGHGYSDYSDLDGYLGAGEYKVLPAVHRADDTDYYVSTRSS